MQSPLTLPEFIARWQGSTLSERSAAPSHFIDLCAVLRWRHADEVPPPVRYQRYDVSRLAGRYQLVKWVH